MPYLMKGNSKDNGYCPNKNLIQIREFGHGNN
jgi:hypothetical protein